jgi:hypothetical protein
MKCISFTITLLSFGFIGYAQLAKNALDLTVSGKDRISVVRSSVHLAEWHEKDFWPLYDKYMNDAVNVSTRTFRSVQDLANTDQSIADQEAFENGWDLLTYRNDDLKLKKQYYQQVGAALNGVVALQFLQTETMMDMLETSQIYGNSYWKNYRFHTTTMPAEQARQAKHNLMTSALQLPADKKDAFWAVYSKYEDECDALLGEKYSVYSLFSSDASDFTPALAKRLGNDLLQVMEREIRLKERYYLEMNASVGSQEAARFLAWEDYYSVVAKMYAWADDN